MIPRYPKRSIAREFAIQKKKKKPPKRKSPKKITAKYINGVLEVGMPKKKAATVKTVSIEIE